MKSEKPSTRSSTRLGDVKLCLHLGSLKAHAEAKGRLVSDASTSRPDWQTPPWDFRCGFPLAPRPGVGHVSNMAIIIRELLILLSALTLTVPATGKDKVSIKKGWSGSDGTAKELKANPTSMPPGPTPWLFQQPPAESKLQAATIIVQEQERLTKLAGALGIENPPIDA